MQRRPLSSTLADSQISDYTASLMPLHPPSSSEMVTEDEVLLSINVNSDEEMGTDDELKLLGPAPVSVDEDDSSNSNSQGDSLQIIRESPDSPPNKGGSKGVSYFIGCREKNQNCPKGKVNFTHTVKVRNNFVLT